MVLKVDVKSIIFEEKQLAISGGRETRNIDIWDVIGCRLSEEPNGFLSGLFGSAPHLSISYISRGKNYRWSAETVQVTGSKEECGALQNRINDKLGQERDRPKKLGVFINPNGGSQNSLGVYSKVVSPLFQAANISCDVNVSERPKHMIELVNSFDKASVDGLVVMGGDGTVLEVINTLLTRVQKEADLDYDQPTCKLKPLEIPIGIIPTGTGNGVAKCLNGNMDVVTAVLHIIRGKTNQNNIQGVYSGGRLVSFSSVIVACGFFSDMMYETDRQRWLKRARYAVVPLSMVLFTRPKIFKVKVNLFPGKYPSETKGGEEETLESKEIEWPVMGVSSFTGDYYNNATDSKMDFVAMLQDSRKTGLFTVLFFKETSKLEFMSSFLDFLSFKRTIFERESLSTHTVRGCRVKMLWGEEKPHPDSKEGRMNRLLDIDGEIMDIADGEYEVWNHMHLLTFYTSH
ncbi:uncharacterized protein LOC111133383 isoform X1 [Crassostrea virginica]